MATLNGQKQQLLDHVKNSPDIRVSTIVELVMKYDDLSIEDFNGIIPELLYAELLGTGCAPKESGAAQREQDDWIILETGNYNALHMYKQKYPNSVHLDELDDLMWTNSTIVVSMHSLTRYLTDWPNGKHAAEARQ